MRLTRTLTCNYFNDQGLLPGSVARYGVYVTQTGDLRDIGQDITTGGTSGLVANIWPFLNRDADSVSQWIQPAGWVSLKNENPNTTVNYYGFFNDVKIFPQGQFSFTGFNVRENTNHYAYSNPLQACPQTGSRISTLVCTNQLMVPAGKDFPCDLLRLAPTSLESYSRRGTQLIFPNPTHLSFTVTAFSTGEYNLTLLGADGKVIYSYVALDAMVNQSFNIEQLPAGVYYLHIQTPTTIRYEKVIKH